MNVLSLEMQSAYLQDRKRLRRYLCRIYAITIPTESDRVQLLFLGLLLTRIDNSCAGIWN